MIAPAWAWWFLRGMNERTETKRLAAAVAGVAATIAEIIDVRVQKLGELMEQKVATRTLEPMLTRKQLAEYFQVTVRTIENWTHDGRLPYLKISSEVRYPMSEIMAFVKANNMVHRPLHYELPRRFRKIRLR